MREALNKWWDSEAADLLRVDSMAKACTVVLTGWPLGEVVPDAAVGGEVRIPMGHRQAPRILDGLLLGRGADDVRIEAPQKTGRHRRQEETSILGLHPALGHAQQILVVMCDVVWLLSVQGP